MKINIKHNLVQNCLVGFWTLLWVSIKKLRFTFKYGKIQIRSTEFIFSGYSTAVEVLQILDCARPGEFDDAIVMFNDALVIFNYDKLCCVETGCNKILLNW